MSSVAHVKKLQRKVLKCIGIIPLPHDVGEVVRWNSDRMFSQRAQVQSLIDPKYLNFYIVNMLNEVTFQTILKKW